MECCLECDLDMAAVLEDDKTQPYYIQHYTSTTASEELDVSADTAASEECSLCLEAMHPSDLAVPMLCPQVGCQFNFCTQCVWNLLLTSSQPYQEASDGSNQLKIPLQCPQCRTKYPQRQVLQDVLLVRQACRLQKYFFADHNNNNSNISEATLKASELATKQAFLEQVTWEALKESWVRVDKYLKDHGKVIINDNNNSVAAAPSSSMTIPKLPAQWKAILMHKPQQPEKELSSSPSNASTNVGMGQAQYTLVDPTLFRGMEESMTLDEQQFLSELLVSGTVPNLTQAAQILYGMLQVLQKGGVQHRDRSLATSFSNISDNHTTSTGNNANSKYTRKKKSFRLLTTGTNLLYPDMDPAILKKKFPLPPLMPRWIILPIYHPEKRGAAPWKLKNHNWGLEIVSVKGAAGQQGLRCGDVITHINEESVETCSVDEFNNYMKTLYKLQTSNTMSLVVNAHPEAAQALQQRSYEMIHFLTERQREREEMRLAATASSSQSNSNSNRATTTAATPAIPVSRSRSSHSTTTNSSSQISDDGEQYVIRNTRSGMK